MLAGGLSRRLGRDKAVEVIGGTTVLQRVVDVVSTLSSDVLLITAPGPGERPLDTRPGLRWLSDLYPGKGSLGGIYTGLYHASFYHSLVVACDMPFLNLPLLRYLVEQAPGHDIVIPYIGTHQEPLHAVYSRDCLGPMRDLIEQDCLQIIRLLPLVRVRRVAEPEIDRFDPERLCFFNINTLADLEWARRKAAALSAPVEERP